MSPDQKYQVRPISPMRRFAMDAGYLGRQRHIVHGLLEIDVTQAREAIRRHAAETGEKLSFTAFVIHCLSRAIQQNPELHAYRDWRNRLIIYDNINVNAMFEVQMDGRRVPMPYIFHATNRKTFRQIYDELRQVQRAPEQTEEQRIMRWFLYLPAFMRRLFYRLVLRLPQLFRARSSSVLVTAVGMFGKSGGWAITMPSFTLTIAVGGIARKPGVYQDEIVIREFLDLTISVDHDIVDGAPIARFAHTYQSLLESAYGLAGE